MSFKKNTCVHGVDLNNGGVIDIIEKDNEEEMKVFPSSRARLFVVIDRNSV